MAAQIQFRNAIKSDIPSIVELLANDELGKQRERLEDPLPDSYYEAFEAIKADPNNELIVAYLHTHIIGVLQMTFTPYLTYQGGWRATIEGVRISPSHRGEGLGTALFEWAIQRAKQKGCHLVQLTTDKQRPQAIYFYEKLGFQNSHEGMKRHL